MLTSPELHVFKFGGASVKDAPAIRNLARIVREHGDDGQLLIVVSAMGKTTNALEEVFRLAYQSANVAPALAPVRAFHEAVAHELAAELSADAAAALFATVRATLAALDQAVAAVAPAADYDEQYDQVVSFGELLSSGLVAGVLGAAWLDCRPLVRTDATWRAARVDWPATEQAVRAALPPRLAAGPVVTQGFLGGTATGRTTTLGREGSDFSAAIFAHCLRAADVTIWKDVAGLLNADPKIFPDTVRYPEISYQETIEMAYYGASVIHPKTIKPLAVRQIPLLVKSFLEPAAPGTRIHECLHPALAPAYIRKTGQCLISFESKDLTFISEENLAVIFGALARVRLKINLMQNSAISFSACTDFSAYRVGQLVGLLREQFTVYYNTELELYTVKNYTAASVARLTAGRTLLLEQRTRQTFQFVSRAGA